MKVFSWLKKMFGNRKGTHTPYMGSKAHFTELEIEEIAQKVDEIHRGMVGESRRVKQIAMQISESLGRDVSELEILDLEARLARFPRMTRDAEIRAQVQVGPLNALLYQEFGIHSDARAVWPGVQGEVIAEAERFSQSWSEMVIQLKGYSVDELEQKIPMPGTVVSYADCIHRTIEELQDEVRQLDGLLAEMPRERKESS